MKRFNASEPMATLCAILEVGGRGIFRPCYDECANPAILSRFEKQFNVVRKGLR